MDAQAIYMYQRNPNDQGPGGPQRPGNGSNGNNGRGPRNGSSLLVRSLIIIGVMLLVWYFFQFFFSSGSNNNNQNAVDVPYSTFYQQVQSSNVKDVTFQGQEVTGDFKTAVPGTDANGNPRSITQFHFTQLPYGDPNLITLLNNKGVQFQAKPASDNNL